MLKLHVSSKQMPELPEGENEVEKSLVLLGLQAGLKELMLQEVDLLELNAC